MDIVYFETNHIFTLNWLIYTLTYKIKNNKMLFNKGLSYHCSFDIWQSDTGLTLTGVVDPLDPHRFYLVESLLTVLVNKDQSETD